jgi:hypothetical protein
LYVSVLVVVMVLSAKLVMVLSAKLVTVGGSSKQERLLRQKVPRTSLKLRLRAESSITVGVF